MPRKYIPWHELPFLWLQSSDFQKRSGVSPPTIYDPHGKWLREKGTLEWERWWITHSNHFCILTTFHYGFIEILHKTIALNVTQNLISHVNIYLHFTLPQGWCIFCSMELLHYNFAGITGMMKATLPCSRYLLNLACSIATLVQFLNDQYISHHGSVVK